MVSASSEQYEIDLYELSRLATKQEPLVGDQGQLIGTDFTLTPDNRCIHLLANGYPVNFWGMGSMPEEASDLILTIMLLASVELARGTYNKACINESAVNELVDEKHYNLAGRFLEIYGCAR